MSSLLQWKKRRIFVMAAAVGIADVSCLTIDAARALFIVLTD
ncbi:MULTISPECIES: hypothetical protein [unclassified Caballeronia]|nr:MULTISPECIES: hypothetical protein [unclassified Caballeronia]